MTKNHSNLYPITSATDNKTITTGRRVLEPQPNSNEYITAVGDIEKIVLAEKNEDMDYMYDLLSACLTPESELDFNNTDREEQ